jgi:hypothetical protein
LINKTLEKTEGTMMNGQSRDAGSIWHNNPETLAAFGTTIQRRWQHLAQDSKTNRTRKTTQKTNTFINSLFDGSIFYYMDICHFIAPFIIQQQHLLI